MEHGTPKRIQRDWSGEGMLNSWILLVKKTAKMSLNVSKTFWPWRNLDQIHHTGSLWNLSDKTNTIAPDCSWKEDLLVNSWSFLIAGRQDWRLNGGSKFLKGVRLFENFRWADDGDDDRKRVVNLNEQYELGERKSHGENSIECFWLPIKKPLRSSELKFYQHRSCSLEISDGYSKSGKGLIFSFHIKLQRLYQK